MFIHRGGCERYDARALPDALRTIPLTLEGYGDEGALIARRRVLSSPFEAVLDDVFRHGEVQYAHLRNTEAGCFIARIDRLAD